MDHFPSDLLTSVLALLVAVVTFCRSVYMRKKAEDQASRLDNAEEELRAVQGELIELKQKYRASLEFQKSLSEAEITTRLQQPRLAIMHGQTHVEAPERYHYVRTLAQNGMGAKEIAAVLSISTHEAQQLVNLCNLATKCEPDDSPRQNP